MGALTSWIGAKPHRATVLNILMLTLLLALVGSVALFGLVGRIVLLIAGLHFLWRALARTWDCRSWRHPFEFALLWVPGLIAIALSATAILLLGRSAPGSLQYAVAFALFGCEVAILVGSGSEAVGAAPSSRESR
ncbi:MAG: hypothetical protein U1E53_18210 [Dongiaceae bacterium]